jgi:hypothetical protein
MVQEVKHLLSKCKTLSSNPSTIKKIHIELCKYGCLWVFCPVVPKDSVLSENMTNI